MQLFPTLIFSQCTEISILHFTWSLYLAEADFTPGRYIATFTSGSSTAIASIPIAADDIDEPTEQFSLILYIDGAGYGMGLQGGNIIRATVSITQPNVTSMQTVIYCVVFYIL